MRLSSRLRLFWFLLTLISFPALGHTDVGVAGGLLSGLIHPVKGLDHLVAMIAVGLWGAQLRQPAIWLLPITFPLVMALGGLAGLAGLPLPGLEIGIAVSAIALGLAVGFAWRAPLWLAGLLVALFALFHGYAHGRELPQAADPLAYGAGFVVATGLLHLCGIGLGALTHWPRGAQWVRALGVGIAVCGGYFLLVAAGGAG